MGKTVRERKTTIKGGASFALLLIGLLFVGSGVAYGSGIHDGLAAIACVVGISAIRDAHKQHLKGGQLAWIAALYGGFVTTLIIGALIYFTIAIGPKAALSFLELMIS